MAPLEAYKSGQGKILKMLVCDHCGIEFECRHKKRLEAKNHFCSRKCMGEYRKAHNPNYVACEVCGKLIRRKPNELKRIKHHTCSYKCMGELRKSIYLGDKNPNYGNTGIKNPISLERRISNYGYVLLKMPDHPFARDGGWVMEHRYIAEQYLLTEENSAEINGKKYLRRDLEVHHIDGNKINNAPSNLMVLTKSEHMKLHVRKRKGLSLLETEVGFGSTGN